MFRHQYIFLRELKTDYWNMYILVSILTNGRRIRSFIEIWGQFLWAYHIKISLSFDLGAFDLFYFGIYSPPPPLLWLYLLK